jgi:hypothetical protein
MQARRHADIQTRRHADTQGNNDSGSDSDSGSGSDSDSNNVGDGDGGVGGGGGGGGGGATFKTYRIRSHFKERIGTVATFKTQRNSETQTRRPLSRSVPEP